MSVTIQNKMEPEIEDDAIPWHRHMVPINLENGIQS